MLTGIDKISAVDVASVSKVVDQIVRASIGLRYASTVELAEKVQFGEIIILDTGSVRRIYVRTGESTVAYVALT